MASSVELLSREARAPRPLLRLLALVVLVALVILSVLPRRTQARTSSTLVVTSVTDVGSATIRTVPLSSKASADLERDLAVLQPGRISCGSPGPAGVLIQLVTESYDVNGECARVVREGTSTALVESTALHDDLVMLSGP